MGGPVRFNFLLSGFAWFRGETNWGTFVLCIILLKYNGLTFVIFT